MPVDWGGAAKIPTIGAFLNQTGDIPESRTAIRCRYGCGQTREMPFGDAWIVFLMHVTVRHPEVIEQLTEHGLTYLPQLWSK